MSRGGESCGGVPIDLCAALGALGGDEQLLRECLELIVQDLPAYLERLEDAVARGDLEETAAVAHTIKGSVAVVSAHELREQARALELAARGGLNESLPQRLAALLSCWGVVSSFLREQGYRV